MGVRGRSKRAAAVKVARSEEEYVGLCRQGARLADVLGDMVSVIA